MTTATLTNQYQITVPAEIRDRLDLKPGDKINFTTDKGSYIVTKQKTLSSFAGIAKDTTIKATKADYENFWLDRTLQDKNAK